MANILQTINNFVTVSYDYLVDASNNISKHVNINSNTVPINIASASNSIQTSASIQYSYTVDPADAPKTTIVNSALVETVFGAIASLANSTKHATLKYADLNDFISYAVTVVNNGSVSADNIVFKDTLPQGITFVTGSLMLDGVAYSDANANPTTGFNIGAIPAGMSRIVTFKVQVTSIPTGNTVNNIASFAYDFLINPNDQSSKQSGTDTTGAAVVTTIAHANLSSVTKIVDKKSATLGDILTYTSTIPNTGNVDAINVTFTEPIPDKTQLVAGSISATVDSVPVSVNSGGITDTAINSNLGTIPAGKQAVVVFKVKVIKN